MKRNKKIIIGIGILIISILLWQFGFFSRFNYLTAKIDIWKNEPRLVTCEFSYIKGNYLRKKINEKYGFYKTNEACFVSQSKLNGIRIYNAEINKYLNKRNGKDWYNRYQLDLNSLTE